MREFIDIVDLVETNEKDDIGTIKKTIVSMIKTVDEKSVLKKVLQTLQAGNLDERIENVIKTDADAKTFVRQITSAIMGIDAPIEEKDEFLKKYPKGILNVSKLLDGSPHTFGELVGEGFSEELFTQLAVSLSSQGVGPGEIALSVFSPKIKWSGRTAGGGDIIVDGKNVEVKTSIKSGGRWLNARKANMNMPAIKDAITTSTGMEVPDRLGLNMWVDTYRPAINEKTLPKVCKIIGKGLFTAVDTSAFEKALATGDAKQIQDELLRTGFENYKKLSGFDGMLMMDVATKTAQYFNSYDDMADSIRVSSPYLYGPEGEAMPKVSLKVSDSSKGSDSKDNTSKKDKDTTDKPKSEKDFTDKASQIATGKTSKKEATPKVGDVGRAKRKK